MNSVSWTDVKINMKSLTSLITKIVKSVLNLIVKHVIISWVSIMIIETALIMKFIMKSTAKSVINMNMYINLNENIWIVFMKKIHIVLSIMSWIMFLNKSENKSFWNQIIFQNTIKKNLWCIYAFWTSIRITEVTHLSTWSVKYDFKKNELRHEFW